ARSRAASERRWRRAARAVGRRSERFRRSGAAVQVVRIREVHSFERRWAAKAVAVRGGRGR
ncbi:MAG: hypothetical protein ACREMM_08390, partial [Gemmatimonadales bacterium]